MRGQCGDVAADVGGTQQLIGAHKTFLNQWSEKIVALWLIWKKAGPIWDFNSEIQLVFLHPLFSAVTLDEEQSFSPEDSIDLAPFVSSVAPSCQKMELMDKQRLIFTRVRWEAPSY